MNSKRIRIKSGVISIVVGHAIQVRIVYYRLKNKKSFSNFYKKNNKAAFENDKKRLYNKFFRMILFLLRFCFF